MASHRFTTKISGNSSVHNNNYKTKMSRYQKFLWSKCHTLICTSPKMTPPKKRRKIQSGPWFEFAYFKKSLFFTDDSPSPPKNHQRAPRIRTASYSNQGQKWWFFGGEGGSSGKNGDFLKRMNVYLGWGCIFRRFSGGVIFGEVHIKVSKNRSLKNYKIGFGSGGFYFFSENGVSVVADTPNVIT